MSDQVEIECVEVIKHAASATLFEVEGDEVWIPHSQIKDDSEVHAGSEEGEVGTLVIPSWLAEKEGWA